jgi:hypothetical protein
MLLAWCRSSSSWCCATRDLSSSAALQHPMFHQLYWQGATAAHAVGCVGCVGCGALALVMKFGPLPVGMSGRV